MSAAWIELAVAILLGVGTIFASAGLWPIAAHSPRTRIGLVLLQALAALALHWSLFPPERAAAPRTLTILTADWQTAVTPDSPLPDVTPRLALPEAHAPEHTERVPDLATALRRYPQASRIQLIGRGLTPRDWDAARGVAMAFTPSPPTPGVLSMRIPKTLPPGNAFVVHGRVQGLSEARVELRDPSDALAAQTEVQGDGRFELRAQVRGSGTLEFELRLVDQAGQIHEQIPLPVQVTESKPVRLWILAGAANPELKYLRRWARDSGIELHTRITSGAGVVLGDAARALSGENLRDVDAVLLDGRRLDALSDTEVRILDQAVREGLGVIVRLDGSPSQRSRQHLSAWGLALTEDAGTALVQLPGGTRQDPLPVLHRRTVMPEGEDWAALWRDAHGTPLGAWSSLGRGRIALVTLVDSFQLVLGGHPEQHATLWSQAIGRVARGAAETPQAERPWPIWQDERAQFCGLDDAASIRTPADERVDLIVDPVTGSRRCAAFWPEHAGWHVLEQARGSTPFLVWSTSTAPAWREQRNLDATRARLASDVAGHQDGSTRERGPAWPWFIAFVCLAGLVWRTETSLRRSHPKA